MRWTLKASPGGTRQLLTDEIIAQVRAKTLAPETLAWREGMSTWTPISQIPEFASAMGEHAPVPPGPPPIAPAPGAAVAGAASGSTPLAVILLFLCGPFGLGYMWIKRMWTQGIRIAVTAGYAVLLLVMVAGGRSGGDARTAEDAAARDETRSSPAAQPQPQAIVVPIKTLLNEYKDNEVRADAQFEGKLVQITGTVGEVKKDILGDIYVTLGTGAPFEIPVAQCFFDDKHTKQAAMLSKGTTVTIRGRVDGLMMNVIIKDAEFVR